MVSALIITHGDIGQELVRVVEMILGPVDGLDFMSNHGKSAPDLTAAIGEWLDGKAADGDSGGAVIMIDDIGGSCATAAQLACGEKSDTAILSGVNLAMLLGFVTWRDSGEFGELARRLVQKSREAIIQLGGN